MTRMYILTIVIHHSAGSPSLSNQTTQRNKRHPNRPGGGQTLTFHRQHDILYGKPKRFHQKKKHKKKTARTDLSSAKLQDIKSMHKNRLHPYTPTMKQQKEKSRKRSHSQWHQKP